MTVAAVILAAGASRRLGQPKQLVIWEGEPLLRRAARVARESGFRPVRVVLGAGAEACRDVLAGLEVEIVLNAAWEEGLGSSVRAGVAALPSEVDGLLLLVCDQPALERGLLDRFLAAHAADPDRVVASCYAGIRGIPALFPRRRFPELSALRGDRGARGLLGGVGVLEIPFPGGEEDLDTPEDLARLKG